MKINKMKQKILIITYLTMEYYDSGIFLTMYKIDFEITLMCI